MFTLQAETVVALRCMEDGELDLLEATLDCLCELLQGPCTGNQELISRDDAFLNAVDKVLQSTFHARNAPAKVLSAKAKAIAVLAALLEGRMDW